jgi:hypothetical protein
MTGAGDNYVAVASSLLAAYSKYGNVYQNNSGLSEGVFMCAIYM